MRSETRYRAFISYSHKDDAWARRIHRDLESYPLPKRLVGRATAAGPVPRRLSPIFRDQDELPAAQDLSDAVRTALGRSDALLVICSPAAAASRWVNREIEVFRELNPDGRILTAVVGGDPEDSLRQPVGPRACFPESLLELDADGGVSEPLAADFRPEGPGERAAILKLVSGLLDLSLDDLVQRDLQRRQRRVTAITAISLSLSLVMAGLTAFALSAQSEAERRKAEAEDLIEFMLSELQDRLAPVGRLDVLDAVGEKVIEYYQNQPAGALGADELGRRSQAFHLLGRIDDNQGDHLGAFERFLDAYEATERLLEAAPDDPDRIFDHSQSAFWVGQSASRRGDQVTAERHFSTYRDLALRLVEIDAGRAEWQMEAAYAHTNLAVVYLRQQRLDEAKVSALRSLNIKLDLVDTFENQIRAWLDIANSYAWIADIDHLAGKRSEAVEWRRRQVEVFEGQLADSLADWQVREDAIEAELGLIRTLVTDDMAMTEDELELALALAESTRVEAQAIVTHDPSNSHWIATAASIRLWASSTYLKAGNIAAARRAQREATAYLAQPALLDGEYEIERSVRRRALIVQARILLASGQFSEAEEEAQHLLDLLMMEQGANGNVIPSPYVYAAASNLLADALIAQGDPDAAIEIRQRVIAVLDQVETVLSPETSVEYRRARAALAETVTADSR